MPDYLHHRRGEDAESFFCRFTFGQFFALLVLEVFTLFFVFYLGARYGRGLLGLDQTPAAVTMEEGAAATVPQGDQAAGDQKVPTTADPEVVKMADQLIAKAETPELKDRIKKMIEQAQGGAATVPSRPVEIAPPADAGSAAGPKVITIGNAERPPADAAVATPEQPAALNVPQQRSGTAVPPTEAGEDIPDLFKKGQQRPDADTQAKSDAATTAEAKKPGASDAGVIRVKSAEGGRYSVQIGSYPQLDEATRIVERWKGKGYPAYLMIADIPDRGRWYRVRIGGFGSREEAAKYLNDFSSKEGVEALVVLNEQ